MNVVNGPRTRTLASRRGDRGATAVIFAIVAVILLSIGAVAVDIGQAYAKRSLLQTDVDLAVMAAAAELDGPGACSASVVATATEFLEKAENAVPGQYDVDLMNADDRDGFIRCANWKVSLWAPKSHVEYGLGQLISDSDGMDVQAKAAAQIKSPRATATVPFFSVVGCDSGQQSIRNPSGPVTTPVVPPLLPTSTSANNASFTITPTSAPAGLGAFTITLDGSGFKDVSAIGFTGPGGVIYHHEVPVVPVARASTRTLTAAVPLPVLLIEDTWFVRVRTLDGKWSEQASAQPFTVGDEKLYCDARNDGNFGTLNLPRNDSTPAEWLALNMIRGIQPTLAVHPSPHGQCDGAPGSVVSVHSPVNGTNCVGTETGLKVSATNDGLVTGGGGHRGRLDSDSTDGCSRNGSSSRTSATVKGVHLNDDVLTCFIVNGADLGDLVAGTADGVTALSADIFSSPRFFWLPVLDTDPATGMTYWPIVAFRPAFITDQAATATHDAPGTLSALNGIEADPEGISEVRILIFSADALPEFAPAQGGETEYSGSGTKVIVLVE